MEDSFSDVKEIITEMFNFKTPWKHYECEEGMVSLWSDIDLETNIS